MSNSNASFDSDLFNVTLNDIEDLPEYVTPPAGVHKAAIVFIPKDNNVVVAEFTYEEAIELANPEVAAPKQGDKFTSRYDLANEYGLGNFKKLLVGLTGGNTSGSLKDIIEDHQNSIVRVTTGIRKAKNKETNEIQEYLQIKNCTLD